MNDLKCPSCGKIIQITEAFQHQIEEQVTSKLNEKYRLDFDKQKEEFEKIIKKKAQEDYELKMKDKTTEVEETREKTKKLQEEILEMSKSIRQLKNKDDEREIETRKKIEKEVEKIRLKEQEKAQEEQHKKIAEKDKQLSDALKEVEDMKRKLQQGSQQLQGETFEVEFETLLLQQYPNDKILPVGKGIKGGDIIQEVWDAYGNYTGKILWELKNTKTWSESWIDKLKGDKRTITADEAILISQILPSNIKMAGFKNGVWVTEKNFVIPLADTMRAKLIQLYHVKKANEGKNDKVEILYNYLSGNEFKNRVEAIIEAFSNMQTEIEKEKRYFSNKWARDEKNIRQVIDNTYGMHGDLKGIIGISLQEIKGLDLPEQVDDLKKQRDLLE